MTVPERPARDADRYGGRRGPGQPWRRLLALAGIAVLAAGLLGYVVWVGLDRGNPAVRWQLVSFDVRQPGSASVDVEVTAPKGRTAECDIVALDRDHGTAGFTTVTVEGGATRSVHVTVPTRAGAVAVDVPICRLRKVR